MRSIPRTKVHARMALVAAGAVLAIVGVLPMPASAGERATDCPRPRWGLRGTMSSVAPPATMSSWGSAATTRSGIGRKTRCHVWGRWKRHDHRRFGTGPRDRRGRIGHDERWSRFRDLLRRRRKRFDHRRSESRRSDRRRRQRSDGRQRGNDTFRGEISNDTQFGGPGNDELRGGDDNDDLAGGDDDDVLFGLPGDDALDGGNGTDTTDGGGGIDTCVNGETVANCEG